MPRLPVHARKSDLTHTLRSPPWKPQILSLERSQPTDPVLLCVLKLGAGQDHEKVPEEQDEGLFVACDVQIILERGCPRDSQIAAQIIRAKGS